MASPDPSQRVLLGGGAGVVVLAAALAWWGLSRLGDRQAEAAALAERMGNPALASLLVSPEATMRAQRDAKEIQKLEKQLREGDGAWMEAWTAQTKELAGDGQDWAKDPGKWKDRLISVESAVQKAAKDGKVQLGPEFYLGLESYRQKNPAASEIPELALHLSVAERLVRRLLEARKVNEQYPTVCRLESLSGPGSELEAGSEAASAPAPAPGAAPEAGPKRKFFRLELRCSPEVLYEYVRRLAQDPALFILTDLAVTNEKEKFPLRSEVASRLAPAAASPGKPSEGTPERKKLLEILAGKESLVVTLALDFVPWRESQEGSAQSPASAPR